MAAEGGYVPADMKSDNAVIVHASQAHRRDAKPGCVVGWFSRACWALGLSPLALQLATFQYFSYVTMIQQGGVIHFAYLVNIFKTYNTIRMQDLST